MKKSPRRSTTSFNTKRKIQTTCNHEELAALAALVHYTGNPDHKKNPGDYGLDPRIGARVDKTLCDGVGIHNRADALRLLQEGIKRGLVSEQFRGAFPQNVWAVTESGEPLQAALENREQGTYHGYPLPQADPFGRVVLEHWSKS